MDLFHPLVRDWFREEIGEPTAAQELAWPRIAAGEHVLVTAPTGSGKTLTAFLWALDRLLTGAWESGQTRVLYISPLKALNTDVRRNLLRPLEGLQARFAEAEEPAPGVRVMTRSGDTSQKERRQMMRSPPEILITTPESLNILLTSQNGRRLLTGLETVILDEIHAVAGGKRGTHLITAVDRLVPLCGEFQRIALSATVRPLDVIAEMVGGFSLEYADGEAMFRRRRVATLRAPMEKIYDVRVCNPARSSSAVGAPPAGPGQLAGAQTRTRPSGRSPDGGRASGGADGGVAVAQRDDDARWDLLAEEFRKVIRGNRSTLLFANSRRMTERVVRLVNQSSVSEMAWSHHGSLSREVRSVVEEKLKNGELPAIVATNSLELGIDVGALDEVVLIQTPPTISSAIQRVGRAGHGVGETSRGRLYPTFGRDFLGGAVVARAIMDQEIEEIRPILAPLDVLAQIILSMTAAETWDLDDLFDRLRTSYPYRRLGRRQFDLVLDMLAGRYADTRIRELKARVTIDRVENTVHARPGSARLIYMAGGTIADRGYYTLRLEDGSRLGELDEEFVWERSLGDAFILGAQTWQIRRITHNDVVVAPGRGRSAMAPFWRADSRDSDAFFADKIAAFLAWAERCLSVRGEGGDLRAELADQYRLEPSAIDELIEFLELQRSATGALPQEGVVLVERVSDRDDLGNAMEAKNAAQSDGDGPAKERVVLHTLWGGMVNHPFLIALQSAWEERWGERLEGVHDDDCLMLLLPRGFDAGEIFDLVDPLHLEDLLRRRLEATGFFGARFRLGAGVALLLPRAGFQRRTPLWLHRQRSKKLLDAVRDYGDFPILVETWRACLQDDVDLETLRKRLTEVRQGAIRLREVRTEAPSPFASGLVWQLTNRYMYEDDVPETGGAGVRSDLLRELVFSSQMRPRLPAALVERFRRKVQRTLPGYAPRDAEELLNWIDERLVLTSAEWRELSDAASTEYGLSEQELLEALRPRATWVRLPGTDAPVLATLDRVVRTLASAWEEQLDLFDALDPSQPLSPPALAAYETLAKKPREEIEIEAARGEIVSEMLRFYGPVDPSRIVETFGFEPVEVRAMLDALREEQQVVIDQITIGAEELEVCDVENLEVLLRWLRQERRPSFEALPLEKLPLFLAWHQGLARRGDGMEDLQDRLEQLFGAPAKAQHWEEEILPARLSPYYPAWLDSLVQESGLLWWGCGEKRTTFTFSDDLELFRDPAEEAPEKLGEVFPPGGGKHTLGDLSDRGGRALSAVTEDLWTLAWSGWAVNDTFLALRKGVESRFAATETAPRRPPTPSGRTSRRSGRRMQRVRWESSRAFHGHWRALEPQSEPIDLLDEEDLNRDRVRLLLRRYGLLFRELLQRELPALRWGALFRTLRRMELSGEVLAGHFFSGVPGLQFMAPSVFRDLRKGLPEDAVYWMSAVDPASLCGVDVEGLKGRYPSRIPSNHLAFHGARLVLTSRRRGKELEFEVEPDDPRLSAYVEVLKNLLTREFQPLSHIEVEKINGEAAKQSPYLKELGKIFRVVRETKSVKLWKRY